MSKTRLILTLCASGLILAAAGAILAISLSRPSWTEYTSAEGRFQVLMQGPPQEESLPGGQGHSYLWQPRKGTDFMVLYVDLPDEALNKDTPDYKNKYLDTAARALEGKFNGTFQSAKVISYGEYPGREVEIQAAALVYRVRLYLVNNRYYQVITRGSPEVVHSADATRFLDSFKLTS